MCGETDDRYGETFHETSRGGAGAESFVECFADAVERFTQIGIAGNGIRPLLDGADVIGLFGMNTNHLRTKREA